MNFDLHLSETCRAQLLPHLGGKEKSYLGLLVAQRLKRLPAIWEAWVQSLGWEDPLVKKMATHSSVLAWKIPWTEDPSVLQSRG